jgi:medium-chain acyl-[acyl-carrier-protein] hydrolase
MALPVRQGVGLWRYPCAGPVEMRLVCMPHAGSGAFIFRQWPTLLPPGVELVAVELPGRGTRLQEQPLTDLRAAASSLLAEIAEIADQPFALFGHSMGALVAFELALQARGKNIAPACVFLAGCAAPGWGGRRRNLHLLPDDAFVTELAHLGAMPREVLADAGLRAMVLRILRADMTMAETYLPDPGEKLGCDIIALGGASDSMAQPAGIQQWSNHTSASFTFDAFAGGHFFVQSAMEELLGNISHRLGEYIR